MCRSVYRARLVNTSTKDAKIAHLAKRNRLPLSCLVTHVRRVRILATLLHPALRAELGHTRQLARRRARPVA